MITISTTSEEEARDIAEILGTPGDGGIAWPYRIFLMGHEFRPGCGNKVKA